VQADEADAQLRWIIKPGPELRTRISRARLIEMACFAASRLSAAKQTFVKVNVKGGAACAQYTWPNSNAFCSRDGSCAERFMGFFTKFGDAPVILPRSNRPTKARCHALHGLVLPRTLVKKVPTPSGGAEPADQMKSPRRDLRAD